MPRATVEIRSFRPGDEDAVLAFHNAAFPEHPPRSRAHFDWKFTRNPAGPAEMALAFDGDRCVAVYAGMPIRCVLRGKPVLAALHTAVAVAPDRRRGLAGSRLVIEVGKEYTRRFIAGRKPIEWGYPEPALQRVVVRHLQVGVLRDVCWLVRRATDIPPARSAIEAAAVTAIPADVDELWARCAATFGAATVRDAAYLHWRYLAHPDVAYTVVEARAGGRLRGLAVLREGGIDPRLFAIMDWLVADDDRDAEAALLAFAAASARARERAYVGAFVPLALPLARRWQEELGFLVHYTPFQECYRAWGPDLGRRWLAEHWYQTGGDIDFF